MNFFIWLLKQLKRHWSAVIAFLCTWVAPLIIVVIQGITVFAKGEGYRWKLECWMVFILGIIIVVYITKGRKLLEKKLLINEVKGKAKNPVFVLMNGILTVSIFAFIWLTARAIISLGFKIESYLLIVLIFEIAGAFFNFIHSLLEMKREIEVSTNEFKS